ncbi:C6 finger domain-containing protein [Colletotrichum sojae]|uniref:C6 finger domain-containing protein n=1 Tax=Colletotrichum sojae TaxID=2175907 RepID=A0A8H6J4K7_9PEZI|nr:C6 finger domain-containing protein [Colletotrichum sojae]
MTRKGQPKVRTGCLTCKSRKVKCDEAKPACVRCTSTGRKCDGYAVVVPSNRALARARSRAMRLNAALAHASAPWNGDMDEDKVVEHFRRRVAPMMPGHLEGHFWTDVMPRMSRTEPAFRQAFAAIASLMPGLPDSASDDAAAAADPYARVLKALGGNTRKQKLGVDSQAHGGRKRASGSPTNLAATESPASSSSASLSSTGRTSATPLPDANRTKPPRSSTTPTPQPTEDEPDLDPRAHNEINVTLSGCMLFIAVEFLRHGLEAAMDQLASGIDVLNNVDYADLAPTTVDDMLPMFYRLSIIQLCYLDRPNFPVLSLNHSSGPGYNLGPFDPACSSIYKPQCAVDAIILDAIRYIRSAKPGDRTDSRLTSGPAMDNEQTALCGALDKWHAAFLAFVKEPRTEGQPALPPHAEIIRAETEMKYLAAKICVSVCRSHDESVYDCFKDSFRQLTALAAEILAACPDTPSVQKQEQEYRFDFEMSYLPLLEFVITKCRWLEIRYRAWLIVWELAMVRTEPATLGSLPLVGRRMIEREHNARMEEVSPENASLFSLPAEEMRVRDYATDPRFADLVPPAVGGAGAGTTRLPYTQRVLLRCGSYELDELSRWVSRDGTTSL